MFNIISITSDDHYTEFLNKHFQKEIIILYEEHYESKKLIHYWDIKENDESFIENIIKSFYLTIHPLILNRRKNVVMSKL